ncbi:hypothetical protein OAO18_00370 [Francisellaceae bacterium]|nr:hypothetical protein [Francisellaceae bacterium]
MRKILFCTLFFFVVNSSFAESGNDQSGDLSNVGYSSTNVVIPLQANSPGQGVATQNPQANEVKQNFSNLGNQKKGLNVSVSRDNEGDCSDTTNQCSFKPRPINTQQANQRGNGGTSQPNSNWGVQLQRQQ